MKRSLSLALCLTAGTVNAQTIPGNNTQIFGTVAANQISNGGLLGQPLHYTHCNNGPTLRRRGCWIQPATDLNVIFCIHSSFPRRQLILDSLNDAVDEINPYMNQFEIHVLNVNAQTCASWRQNPYPGDVYLQLMDEGEFAGKFVPYNMRGDGTNNWHMWEYAEIKLDLTLESGGAGEESAQLSWKNAVRHELAHMVGITHQSGNGPLDCTRSHAGFEWYLDTCFYPQYVLNGLSNLEYHFVD